MTWTGRTIKGTGPGLWPAFSQARVYVQEHRIIALVELGGDGICKILEAGVDQDGAHPHEVLQKVEGALAIVLRVAHKKEVPTVDVLCHSLTLRQFP